MCSLETVESSFDAYTLLLKAALAIPTWHYVVAMGFVFLVFVYNFLEFHFVEDVFSGFQGCPVLLSYNSCSEIYHQVASKCQTLHGRYLATLWLSSPHIQTVFVNFFGMTPVLNYQRHIFQASDGGTFALDWLTRTSVCEDTNCQNVNVPKDDTAPIMVVIPGLSSDSASPYVKHLAFTTARGGWNVAICNHRGLGGLSVTSDCFYNAGWTEDIREVVKHLHHNYPNAPIFIVGTSIGANILVKYLGEEGERATVAGAAAVCSPWDLLIASRFICRRPIQKLYDRAITFGLQGYAQLHQHQYSRLADWEGIRKSRSIRDFDTYATCLVGKYGTADTYYRQCSSVPFIRNVSVPLLCIGAFDDPLCTTEAIPWNECKANKNIVLAMTKHGGHLAFFEGTRGSTLWWVRAVNEFFNVLRTSSLMHRKKMESSAPHSPVQECSLDQSPYISMSDGKVAAMSTELNDDSIETKPSEVESDEDHNPAYQPSGKASNAVECETTREASTKRANLASRNDPSSDMVNSTNNFRRVTRCLSHISEQNKRSMWVLAYIALLSSWPLLGTALGFLFRKKKKIFLPGKKI